MRLYYKIIYWCTLFIERVKFSGNMDSHVFSTFITFDTYGLSADIANYTGESILGSRSMVTRSLEVKCLYNFKVGEKGLLNSNCD